MQSCSHPAAEVELLLPAVDYISGESFQVARCRRCAQVVTLPVPADLGRYYPAGYYGDKQGRRFPAVMEWLQEQLYTWRARQVLRRLKQKNPRVLDIGCGRGLLLRAFRQNGCDVTGTEYSEAFNLELARRSSAASQSFFSISVVLAGIVVAPGERTVRVL